LIDWGLTALSAQLGYIMPLEVIVCVLGNRKHPGSLVHLLFSSGWPAT